MTNEQIINSEELVLSTFAKDAHYSINKKAIRIIGLSASVLLADLVSKHRYFSEKGQLDDNGFFFSEQEYIEEETGLSKYEQRKAIEKLVELDILETKRYGIPPRMYYKISYNAVITNILNISLIKVKNRTYINKNKGNKVTKVTNRDSSNPVNKDLLFLLEEWRLKDTTPNNQKHPKENSKIHSKIAMLTHLLLNGKFGAHCTITDEFLKNNKIPRSALSEKYTKEELLDGLDEMAKMFKLDNLPEDKTKINKMSFDQLIYHPFAKMSYLLKYLYTDAKQLTCNTVEVYEDWLDKLYDERLFDKDIENDNFKFGILKKGLLSVEKYHAWLVDSMPKVPDQIRTEDYFFNMYVDWLSERNVIQENPYAIGTQSNLWWSFIKWLEEAIYGDYVNQHSSLDRRKYA